LADLDVPPADRRDVRSCGEVRYLVESYNKPPQPKLSKFQRMLVDGEVEGHADLVETLANFAYPPRSEDDERVALHNALKRRLDTNGFMNKTAAQRAHGWMNNHYRPFTMPASLETQDQRREAIVFAMGQVKAESSPGVPFSKLGATNQDILENYAELLLSACLHLLNGMLDENLKVMSLSELVASGYAQVYRVFIKNEPHPRRKLDSQRYRLIFSNSLVFQIVERVLMTKTTKLYGLEWAQGPSMIGIGFTDDMTKELESTVNDMFEEFGHVDESDVSNWDLSLVELLEEARVVCIRKSPPRYHQFWNNYFHLVTLSVCCTSGGSAYHFLGGWKSGQFLTGFLNSIMRNFCTAYLAYAAGAVELRTLSVGDDNLFASQPAVVLDYASVGLLARAAARRERGSDGSWVVEFCSHRYTNSGQCSLTTIGRVIYKLIKHKYDVDLFNQFMMEIRHNPKEQREEIISFLRDIGWLPFVQQSAVSFQDEYSAVGLQRKFTKDKMSEKKKISKIEKDLKRVESRTVSNKATAPAVNAFAERVRGGNLVPRAPKVATDRGFIEASSFLTPEEIEFHGSCKDAQRVSYPLENNNIEPSIHQQQFTGRYMFNSTINSNTTVQFNIMSATSSLTDSDTPKSFSSPLLELATGVYGVPGPADNATTYVSAAVTSGTLTAPSTGSIGINSTVPFLGSSVQAHASVVPVPWKGLMNDGSYLRWQLAAVRVRLINTTPGAKRGGMAYLFQPTNRLDQTNLGAPTVQIPKLSSLGVFKAYNDMTIGSNKKPACLVPRSGLAAFHHAYSGSGAAYTGDLGSAAAFVIMDNTTAEQQNYTLIIELDWMLAGLAVRGIAGPHLIPKSISDRAAEANNVMRVANIIPSEQSAKEHIPAAVALANSPALQLAVHPRVIPQSKTGFMNHPVVQVAKSLVGRHARSIIESGVKGLLRLAGNAAGEVADLPLLTM
jgi:hypothetical protein